MKNARIVFLRSQDIFSDSRVLRYESWYKKEQHDYLIVGWDREGKDLSREHTEYCRIRAGFQQKINAIINRVKWNAFLIKWLFKNRSRYDIIHACDFDTVWPALLMKFFGKKTVFDVFDWFSDEVRTGKMVIDKTINFLEKLAVKCADLVIICEEERLEQMKVSPRQYIVIPNIPSVASVPKSVADSGGKHIRLCYVGGLVQHRGLAELIHVVSQLPDDVYLDVAGFGEESLVEMISRYAKDYANINYYGKVEYSRALEIMGNSDAIYAMYYKTNLNHIYAAPNKFYEAIFLHKPLITTAGTLVGKKVEKAGVGYVIEEGEENLYSLLQTIKRGSFEEFDTALEECEKKYKSYFSDIMKEYWNRIGVL